MVCDKKKVLIKNGSEIIFLHSNKKKMKEIIFLQSYFVLFILHFPNFLKQKLTLCFNFERIPIVCKYFPSLNRYFIRK